MRRTLIIAVISIGSWLVSSAKIQVKGSGSTFQSRIQDVLTDFYQFLPDSNIALTYSGGGSSAGVHNVFNGVSNFGGSDVRPETVNSTYDQFIDVYPLFAGAISISYNLPEVKAPNVLKLSRDALVGIFAGTITRWDDAAIAIVNPGITLPGNNITVVYRGTGSGTTFGLTEALKFINPTIWTRGSSTLLSWDWLVNVVRASSTSGAMKAIIGKEYSIGYIDISDAISLGIPSAMIENRRGQFIGPGDSAGSITAISNLKSTFNTRDFTDVDVDGAYPLMVITYSIVHKRMSQFFDIETVRETLRYLYWSFTDSFGQATFVFNNLSPMSAERSALNRELLKQYSYNNQLVYKRSSCDEDGQCLNSGVCKATYPFSSPDVKCRCNALFTNRVKADCSEESESVQVEYGQRAPILMMTIAVLGIAYTLLIGLLLMTRSSHPIIKSMSPWFCSWILIGCILSYAAIFLYVGEPSAATCGARPFFLTTAVGLVFSMLAAKNWRIYSIFGNVKRMEMALTNTGLFLRFGVVTMVIEWLLTTIWVAAGQLGPLNALRAGDIVVRGCASQNGPVSTAMMSLLFVFNGALILFCLLMTFQIRGYTYQYSETGEISLTMGLVVFQLVIGIPLTALESLDYTSVFVITSVVLSLCPFTLTTILFGPKLYMLYLAKYFKSTTGDTIKNSLASANASVAANQRRSGELQPSGMSFWHFSMKKDRLGSPWFMCTIAMIPEINWMAIVDDFNDPSPKVYEVFKLSEVNIPDDPPAGQDPDSSCYLKCASVDYVMEAKSKEYLVKFRKVIAKVQHGAEAQVTIVKKTATE